MVNSGVTPNEATITAVARLAAAKSDGDLAFELVRTMGKYELSPRLRTDGPALYWFCANLEGEKAWAVEEHMVSMGVHPEEPELAALLKVSAEMGRGDKVYAYLHKLRTAVRSVSESTAEIIEGWFCGEAASEVGGVDCCLGAIEEVALKNGGGWHGQGGSVKGSGWFVEPKLIRVANVVLAGSSWLLLTLIGLRWRRFQSQMRPWQWKGKSGPIFGSFR